MICAGELGTDVALHNSRAKSADTVMRPVAFLVPLPTPVIKPTGLIATLTSSRTFTRPGGPAGAAVALKWHGQPVQVPVLATTDGDLKVRLPTRPNGSTTWISAIGVPLSYSAYRIVINLGTRHLALFQNGVEKLNAPAGVGTVADPTPTGHFFVAFFAKAPSAAWGPFVMVTSAHSVAISDWEESGDAVVAIHGPLGDDAEIGTTGAQISHGCVRLHSADLAQLRAVPDGTPVDIVA